MLHRFATYEEAALFVAKKRSDGYYAEILHDNCSTFWGPLAVAGVSAWVSEEAVEEEEEMPEYSAKGFRLPWVLSSMAMVLMVGLPALALILFIFGLLRHAAHYPGETIVVLAAIILPPLIAISIAAVIGVIMARWLAAYREPGDQMHPFARGLHYITAIILLLVCTPLAELIIYFISGLGYYLY